MLTKSEATWGLRYLLFQLAFLPSLAWQALSLLWPQAQSVHLNLLCWSINFCAVCWIFRKYLLESSKKFTENILSSLGIVAAGFVIYQLLIIGLSALLVRLFPQFFNVNDASIAVSAQQSFPLIAFGTVVLVPIVEEVFYRGLIFGLLPKRFLRYIVSIAIFCTIHVMGYIGYYQPLHLLICFVQYIPAGLVLAACYDFSGSIFVPTAIHMAVNAIAISSMR